MTYNFVKAVVDEFENGSWIADLHSMQSFGSSGTFILPDGSSWTGATLSERIEFDLYHTRVVGGAGKLGASLLDKYYQGNVTAQVALGDICNEAGESAGTVPAGIVMNTFQRQAGITSEALQALADVFQFLWWIDRAGLVNMAATRPTGSDATGLRISSDTDGSATITQPVGVKLGVGYETGQPTAIPVIRHVRFLVTPQVFSAHIFPYPFLFVPPSQSKYDRHYSAVVTADNGDGTVDVKADARFGVSKVRIFCGVPGSKIEMKAGEEVTLFFLAGDPRKPCCASMAQDTNATKQVGRKGDSIGSGSADDSTFWNWFSAFQAAMAVPAVEPGNGSPSGFQTILNAAFASAPFPSSLTGKITSGSDRLKVGD